jgi:dihydropteroate synthase
MGILNVTPDSFYDGGRYNKLDAALAHTELMLSEGATLVDIGGCSSRPGATEVSEEEELQRVSGIVEAVCSRFPDALVSIDTFRVRVAREMLDRGVHIINDITAGSDPGMFGLAAEKAAPLVLMHMQGTPGTMQLNPVYKDITTEICTFFAARINAAREAGVKDLILDPGFGFGKTLSHNYQLFRSLPLFTAMGLPLLVGISRKSMIWKLVNAHPDEVLDLTTALHVKALEEGAALLRVHDVKAAARAITLHETLTHGVI